MFCLSICAHLCGVTLCSSFARSPPAWSRRRHRRLWRRLARAPQALAGRPSEVVHDSRTWILEPNVGLIGTYFHGGGTEPETRNLSWHRRSRALSLPSWATLGRRRGCWCRCRCCCPRASGA
eukprot:scaffold24069_cov34-Phaeocystis_antarctica.AAC.1